MAKDGLPVRTEPTDRCPQCGGDLAFRSPDFAGSVIEQTATCGKCGLRITDVYHFVRADVLDENPRKGDAQCPAR
jgi:C4-type Zn-finger protein